MVEDRLYRDSCAHLTAWVMAVGEAAQTDEILVECPVCGPMLIGTYEPAPPRRPPASPWPALVAVLIVALVVALLVASSI